MNLLFAIKTLALPGGGTERVVTDIAGRLADRGHRVTLLTFDQADARPFYPLQSSIDRIPLGIGNVGRHTRPWEAARRIAALRRVAGKARPDVAVGFMHSAFLPLGLALAGTGIPLVASEHIAYDHYRTRPLQALMLRLTPRLACRTTVISSAIAEGFPAALRRRMSIVPNPVSSRDRRAADVAGNGNSPRTLLAVGRLEAQKDHAILIGAFARLAAEFPDWRLRIVGEGGLRAELEAQVKRLGLVERVALPGATDRIDDEYAAAQLFVMPSRYESFGLTTAEALSHGLPVVGFADCPGTNELVRPGRNGILVDGADREAALAEGLASLMASAELRSRLGAAGPTSIEDFAPERIVDLWETLLGRVAADGDAA